MHMSIQNHDTLNHDILYPIDMCMCMCMCMCIVHVHVHVHVLCMYG